ncbi:MAG: peptide ABC transporter substrate-binding protein [Gemmatimonadales bacterium]|nr:peptide ABC transporter substrate-binding protein [Gemmatimonadales bacterium]
MGRICLFAAAILCGASACSNESASAERGTAVIVTGERATSLAPVLPATRRTADQEASDLVFLRLAGLRPDGRTAGDDGFEPQLARSWNRRDSLTLAFELDPRARWHDGTPVTAHDVTFTFALARDSTFSPALSGLLRHVRSVTAETDHRVVIAFDQSYPEQLYDAAFHVQPLPAHLLERMTPEAMRTSAFVQQPVGDGPYRLVRESPELMELAAVDSFFLGRPGIGRVIFRVASDPDARINLLLSGEADALAAVVPPLANESRLTKDSALRLVAVPSASIAYLLFNQRDPADTSRPHPILSDSAVRRAIVRALDRPSMVRAVFGTYARVPYGPVSQQLWIGDGSPPPVTRDLDGARKLLADAGWTDADGDGIVEKHGRPLRLGINVPAPSASRRQMALQVQEQLRQAGIAIDLVVLEGPAHGQRRNQGAFDIDFSGATQDPTPAGLTQSWSCRGGSNVAHYCDPAVDSLVDRAAVATTGAADLWHAALRRIEDDAPAVFMYAPTTVVAISSRFDHVDIRPGSSWITLWRWTVKPGRAIARDRVSGS